METGRPIPGCASYHPARRCVSSDLKKTPPILETLCMLFSLAGGGNENFMACWGSTSAADSRSEFGSNELFDPSYFPFGVDFWVSALR